MAQAAKSKKAKPKAAQQTAVKDAPNWPLLGLAVIGMVLAAYLTVMAWQEKLVAFCAAGSACDAVLSSRWSTLFGVPTSFWGFLTYALLAAIAWNKRSASQWKAAWIISLFGLLYSLYLTSVSLFEVRAACPYCLSSLALMSAIFITVAMQRPKNLPGFSWGPWLAKSAGGALVIVLALHLHYAGYWGETAGPEDPWIRGLAEHLTKTNAKFYGAGWCPHCKEQKEMFGSSVKRVPYVECSPGGPGTPQAAACTAAGVESYPTWTINGQRYVGTQTLENLAQFSKYKDEGATR
jgi:uncharacterized membrane protein/glutaredoxin